MTTRAMRELERAWAAVHAAADGLRLTLTVVDEPRPRPVQKAAEVVTDITDLIKVGGQRIEQALASEDDARGALGFAQERWLEATGLAGQVTSPRWLFDLDDFVERHGDQWQKWWPPVLAGIEDLIPTVHDTDVALAQCWRELTDRGRVDIGAATVGTLRVGQFDRPPEQPRRDPDDTTTRLRPVTASPRTGDL